MNRTAAAFLIAIFSAIWIADVAAGYLDFGGLPNYGETQKIATSRLIYTSVTPDGTKAGIRPGDILDLSLMSMTLRSQAVLNRNGHVGATLRVPMLRNGAMVYASETFGRRNPTVLDLIDVVLRVLLCGAGVFLIARGTARDSIYAGSFVSALALYEGFVTNFWGPAWVTVAAHLFAVVVLSFPVWLGRYLFAFELFGSNVSVVTRNICRLLAALAFGAFYFCGIGTRVATIFGVLLLKPQSYWISQLLCWLLGIAFFGVAATRARGRSAGAVRWIFGALLFSAIGPFINYVSFIWGVPPPAQGALNDTYVALAFVLPYAILARGLVAIDFVFSRALVYTIVLSVVVAIFILAEQVVERAALGRVQSAVVELAVPLILGLSFKWIEAAAERLVERLLYRDKLRAADAVEALIEDFPHARDVRTLTSRVAQDVHHLMHSPFVCVFREAESTYTPIAFAGQGETFPIGIDDPVFLRLRSKHAPVQTDDLGGALPRHGAVFPLVVFGSVTGALYAQYRESGERFDPDEMDTLKHLAHELAIALLWVEHAPSGYRGAPANV